MSTPHLNECLEEVRRDAEQFAAAGLEAGAAWDRMRSTATRAFETNRQYEQGSNDEERLNNLRWTAARCLQLMCLIVDARRQRDPGLDRVKANTPRTGVAASPYDRPPGTPDPRAAVGFCGKCGQPAEGLTPFWNTSLCCHQDIVPEKPREAE